MDRGIRRIAMVNRGEAAMRLINAVRELRYESAAIGGGYADLRVIALHTRAERTAMFVREADEAVCLDDDRRGGSGEPVPRPRCAGAGARRRRGPMRRGSAGGSSPSGRSSPSCVSGSASCSSGPRPT